MGIMTSQKIASFYDLFKSIDVAYSKEIIKVTGLMTKQIVLKCAGDFWPCFIISSSFQGAKVAVSIKSGILQKLERANNVVSLKFCFRVADKGDPLTFFVNTKSVGYTSYGGSEDMALFSLQFTQRPPDDLIEIMGRILDANVNSKKQKEEKIIIGPDSSRKMNITKEGAMIIQDVPRHCILREISFSGAKVIMMGVAKFLVDKEAVLRLDFDEPREIYLMKGKLVAAEMVEGRKELLFLDMLFDENLVPMSYKIRVNDFLSRVRTDRSEVQEKKAAPPKKPLPAKPATKAAVAKPTTESQQTAWPSPDEIAGTPPAAEAGAPPAETGEAPVTKSVESESPGPS